jgi:hypothetical protein
MGYRSHVILAVETAKLNEGRAGRPEFSQFVDEADKTYVCEDVTYLEWGSVKWYDSYKSIEQAEDFMNELVEETDTLESLKGEYEAYPFQFMRQGEDGDDFEHRGSWDYDIQHGLYLPNPQERIVQPEQIEELLSLIPAEHSARAKKILRLPLQYGTT